MTATYVGRYAPSPTGPLHFGSLVAAIASYLDARQAGGLWHVRIEDLDPPREVPGAADAILRTLSAFGLHWDGEVLYQSQRSQIYADRLAQLRRDGWLFDCACSRREIADTALAGPDGLIYPGTCRTGLAPGRQARALRVRVQDEVIAFEDRAQGHQAQNLAIATGDFVVQRADGMTAYQLAVVIDDAEQSVTHVVRGSDLLLSTPRQIHLQRCLGLSTPVYLHCPVATNSAGEKLSKQTYAPAIDLDQAQEIACLALIFLRQELPPEARMLSLEQLWQQAARVWDPGRFAGIVTAPGPTRWAIGGRP